MIITKRQGINECFVSDLTWHVLDPFGKKLFGHEKIDELIAEGFKYSVKFKSDGEDNIGVSGPADIDAYKGCKLYSIAAMVALDKEFSGSTTLVLMENPEADDESGFAVGLISGNVVLDLSFKHQELEQICSRFDEICNRVSREFILTGDIAPPGKEIGRHCTLNELVSKKSAKKIVFVELKSERTLVFLGIGFAFVVLLLLANGAWDYYKKSERDLLRQVEAMKSTPEYVYGEAAKSYVQQDFVIANKAVSVIEGAVGGLPVTIAGWNLVSLKCGSELCLATWKSVGGTYDSFQQAASSDWKNFRYAEGGKDALGDLKSLYCDIPVQLPKSKLPLSSLWPNSDEFSLEVGKAWQSKSGTGFSGNLKTPELKGVPPGLTSSTLSIVPTAVFAMPWEFRDQDWVVAKSVLREYPDTVTLTDFSVRVDMVNKKILLSASGDGYVRK